MNLKTFCSIFVTGLIVLALLYLREFKHSGDKPCLQIWCSSSNDSGYIAKQKILHLANVSEINLDTPNIDIVYVGDQVGYFSRVLESSNRVAVPYDWCSGDGLRNGLNNSPIGQKLMECYKTIDNSEDDYEVIARSLRMIRNAFRDENVPIVMTYGSLVGSIRYHRRTPFDSDYDLAIQRSRWRQVTGIFYKMALISDNRMRILDLRPVTGCMQIGLACVRNDSWRNPDVWKSFNSSITFLDGIPVAHNWDLYSAFMQDCAIYVDIYTLEDGDIHFKALDDGSVLYRPIEGTLFRTLSNPMPFLESCYNSSVELCVPKEAYLWHGKYRYLPQHCSTAAVPCAWLDSAYPRIFKFTISEKGPIFEVGLDVSLEGECMARSIFFSNVQLHK